MKMPPTEGIVSRSSPPPRRKSLRAHKPAGALKDDLPIEVLSMTGILSDLILSYLILSYLIIGACHDWDGGGGEDAGGLEPK